TPFAVLLNNDAVPEPDWLDRLLSPFTAPGAERLAAVTAKVLFAADGRLNNAGGVVRSDGYARDRGFGEPAEGHYDMPADVFSFSGTAVALRTAALREIGLFADEFFTYYEDTDLSWRLRLAGWQIRYEPTAVVHHLHAATSDVRSRSFAFYNERNRLLMLTRNAPPSTAVRQVVRFVATTLLLALRRLLRVPVPADHQFRLALRMKVLWSYLRLLPRSLQARREIGQTARVGRKALLANLEPIPPRTAASRARRPPRRFGAQSPAGSVESSLHGTGSQETLPASRA
ncbi:MAG: glycosyltransferase family 2 protein, partial [Frankiaceae bacterium]